MLFLNVDGCNEVKVYFVCNFYLINSQVRVAFVGYRDFADRRDRIVSINLTEDTSAVMDFMDEIEANGGGDECEDVFGGLERVLTLDWKFPTRILIHVGDSPQHGSRYNMSRSPVIAGLENLTLM